MSRGLVRWPLWILTRVVLPAILLAAIGAGIVYVRLTKGDISLKPLADPIARAISADLGGLDITVEDAIAQLTDERGLEFRLRNVRLSDPGGATIAVAPDAAVTLSTSALWSGRIAPSRIVLIKPSLVLQHSAERGLVLSMPTAGGRAEAELTGPTASARPAGLAAAGPSALPAAPSPAARGGISAALGQIASRTGTASYIKGIGLRDATLTIESGGQQSMLRIREGDLGVDSSGTSSLLGAVLLIESTRGPWRLSLKADRVASTGALAIDAEIKDLVPSTAAGSSPLLAGLSVVELPVDGKGRIELAGNGEVTSGQLDLTLGRGAVAPGWRGKGRMPVDGGTISLFYEANTRSIHLATSRISSGTSWATFGGRMLLAGGQGQGWPLEIVAREGMIGAQEFAIAPKPLEALVVRGQFDPRTGALEIADATLKAGGGEISLKGTVPARGTAARLSLQGRLSPMSVEALKLMWPSVIAPAARSWSGQQVVQGRVTNGTFIVEDLGPGADRARVGPDGLRIAVAIESSGVRLLPKPGFSPVEAQQALIRFENNTLEVVATEAAVITGPQRRLPLRAVRMIANDVSSSTAFGELTLRALGPLGPALDIAEQQAQRNGRSLSLPTEGLDGRVDAQVRIMVPLGDDLTADDTRLEVKGQVSDGRARGALGGFDVNSASLAVEVTDQQLDVKGSMLVSGVSARVQMKRIFAAPDVEQPPVLITANLDTSDRAQLGLDMNDFVTGEMPLEVLVAPRPQGEPQVLVRANLTNAELHIEPLAWKKARGRPATLQFEIVKPSRQRTELQGFKIVGEDISLSGSLVLDQRNRVREFSFHELALHVVSRLQLSGSQRPDSIWDVAVRGQTLDARDLFQSLFSVGQAPGRQPPPRKEQTGIDLKAEIDNVLGHHDVTMKGLKVQLSSRNGRTTSMTARGVVDGGRPLDIAISQAPREPRRLLARSDDAGQVFRMIGFYPNMVGGRMQLDINLDGAGNADKVGRLYVERFAILGDAVAVEGLDANGRTVRRLERPRLDFNTMNAPFELGHGQILIKDADLRGDVLGVLLRGKADFGSKMVDLGGTYVPLQGLNSAIGQFPILGQLLAGPRGEGVIGMTFAVQGPMAQPQVLVNPVSIVPGIFREMMQMTNPNQSITPRALPPQQQPATKAAPPKVVPPSPARPPSNVRSDRPPTVKSRPASPKADEEGGWSSSTLPKKP